MIHLNLGLPDDVAQPYYSASETLRERLGGEGPNPQTLMRLMLSGFSADEIAGHFERVLRNLTNLPEEEELPEQI